MKALILAAGYGTRLLPYTARLPKPLFTLNNRTVLDLGIEHLLHAGCDRIFINTHHLADQIRSDLNRHPHRDKLRPVHEPEILDTGGAIANLRAELSGDDFLVVNADIIHDLELGPVIRWHQKKRAIATLVVRDDPRFNKVSLGPGRTIENFSAPPGEGVAFTGLQVLSDEIFRHLPDQKAFSSIDLYTALCATGRVLAYPTESFFWQDIGTADAYLDTARKFLSGRIFGLRPRKLSDIGIKPLSGDGSDRKWYRAGFGDQHIILSDHGICLPGSDGIRQLEAFVKIGTHLGSRGLSVPRILGVDWISGQAAVQDLGDVHLSDLAPTLSKSDVFALYQRVIDRLILFSKRGIRGFDTDWTCQTPNYSEQMVMDYECRYFFSAFLREYLKRQVSWQALAPSFSHIAQEASKEVETGLMHRDFQSKNIMLHDGEIFFIDFQSARVGPLAYDLASLLIDPYVTLPSGIQDELLGYCCTRLKENPLFDEAGFRRHYTFCAIARNLQMLGAFGFLTRVKGKSWFKTYIPKALAGLKDRLAPEAYGPLGTLFDLVNTL